MSRYLSVFRYGVFYLCYASFAVLAVGWMLVALVRLTLRDLSPWSQVSMLYYASPAPLLFLSALGLAGFAGMIGHRRGAVSWGLLAVVLTHCAGSYPPAFQGKAMVAIPETQGGLETSEERVLSPVRKLLYWNVSHLQRGLWDIAQEIKAYEPDVVALVEAGPATEEYRAVWQKHFPDYELTFLGGEILVLLKSGTAGQVVASALPHRSRLREIEISFGEEQFWLMVVDIYGPPRLSRKQQLIELAGKIADRKNAPLLVAGDFNTPRDSLLFQPVQQQAENAFDVAGTGYTATWPLPLPVLTIDQVWGNSQVRFHSCRAGWSNVSDHRPILVEFSLAR